MVERLGLALLVQLVAQALGHMQLQQEQANQSLQALQAQVESLQKELAKLRGE